MATARSAKAGRERGEIETLASGSLRVKVYAGVDPLSGKRHYLTETIPAGPKALDTAKKARTRLINQVDEQRSPRTRATVDQLMDRYLEVLDVEVTTRARYEAAIRLHVRPLLGSVPVAKLTGETIDNFSAVLRRCRDHCDGRPFVVHHDDQGPDEAHECTDKCRPHVCKPLAVASIRKIHFCLSGALSRAVRWRWITVNPLDAAEAPRGVTHNPHPPSAEQAATILTAAFAADLPWGVLVWLAMTTGARRGELCALRWDGIDFDRAVLSIRSSIAQEGSQTWEKDTKTHQQRRIALDATTVDLLRAYRRQCDETAAALGVDISPSGRLFSALPDHSTWLVPSSVSQRFARMCARLGWDRNIHELRHYSATELISAGVDVRTVAGRLGHGGGGTTTLRTYAAWVAEADQRAAGTIDAHMPALPVDLDHLDGITTTLAVDAMRASNPYQRIAADLRAAITCGAFRSGDQLPTVEELGTRYGVAPSTAHRAIAELSAGGFVLVSRGRRATIV
ncbi:tyrosine-type recombinase/integrase [Actinomycetes bacterium KLBMP 9759]